MNIESLTAAELLKLTDPEQLFTADAVVNKQRLRKLRSRWHEDHLDPTSPTLDLDKEVFVKVTQLFEAAEAKITADTFGLKNVFAFTTVDGRKFRFKHKDSAAFELGSVYLADTMLCYVVTDEELLLSAVAKIKGLTYANAKMSAEFSRSVPKIVDRQALGDGRHALIIEKPATLIKLRDVLDHFGGKLDPKHVAWITSRLLSILCYLSYTKVAHHDISLDTVFIDPAAHTAHLLGGWWYSAGLGKPLIAAPTRTVSMLIDTGAATWKTDLALIKATARELLGDPHGVKLSKDKTIPAPLVDWLTTVNGKTPFAVYQDWMDRVLKDSFGPRKFTELKLTAGEIYS